MSSLTELQQTVQRICTPLAFITNTVLIQLILYKSPKSLGIYKYLMIYIAIFELLYAIIDVFTAPDCYSHEVTFLVIVRTDKNILPVWMLAKMCATFCSCFGMSMAIFAIHFIYRYLVISGNSFISCITPTKICIWFVSPIIYAFFWFLIVTFLLNQDKFTDQVLIDNYLPQHGVRLSQLVYYGPNYYLIDENGNETINWKHLIAMGIIMTIVASSIVAILTFATLSYRRMATLVATSSNSRQYRNLQIQLLNSLVGQALIPAFLMHMPACFIFISPLFHMGNVFRGGIIGITISLYPVLDPLPTMFVIKHYRKTLLKFRRCGKKNEPTQNVKIPA